MFSYILPITWCPYLEYLMYKAAGVREGGTLLYGLGTGLGAVVCVPLKGTWFLSDFDPKKGKNFDHSGLK